MDTQLQAKVVIHRGSDHAGHYIWSPFVTKVEFRYRFSDCSYSCGIGGAFAGPKGKIPWVELSIPGGKQEVLADSTLIIRTMISNGVLHDANARLSAKEKALDLAIRSMLEEKLYFFNAREQCIDNYYTMRDHTMKALSLPQRTLFGYLAHRSIVNKLDLQGIGRFSDDEIRSFRTEVWESVDTLPEDSRERAGKKECFWVLEGSEPTEADATVFGFIASPMVATAAPESKQFVQTKCPTAVDYATRTHHRYFPSYEIWN